MLEENSKVDLSVTGGLGFAKAGPLENSANYYLIDDHTRSWKKELLLQGALLLVCVSGAYLYFDPAKAFASRVGRPDLAWLYVTGTCFPALATLYVATDIFIGMQLSSNIPEKLENVLVNPKSKLRRFGEATMIGAISLLSSIVLAAVFLRYSPPDWPKWGVVIMTGVILIDNTILHFLPVMLMLTQKIWRAPFLPIELAITKLANVVTTYLRERDMTARDKQDYWQEKKLGAITANNLLTLKMQILCRLSNAKERLIAKSLHWNGMGWDIQLQPALQNIVSTEPQASGLKVLSGIIGHFDAPRPYFVVPSFIDVAVGMSATVAGCFWIWACATGYYAAPFNQFYQWTDNSAVAGLITALPIYSLSVLLAFFGQMFVGQAYGYLTNWGDSITKIPMEIKTAPKIYLACMAVNAVMAGFSYGAAAELVYTQITYPWAQRFVPFLLGCAYSGISYAGFMSTQNFIFSMIGKFARHLPTGEWSQLYQAVEKIGQQANALMLLDDKTFEDELCAMDSETRQTLLGMDDEAFCKQVKHQAHYDQQIAEEKAAAKEPSFFSRLFCCAKTSEQTPLLSDTTEGFGYV